MEYKEKTDGEVHLTKFIVLLPQLLQNDKKMKGKYFTTRYIYKRNCKFFVTNIRETCFKNEFYLIKIEALLSDFCQWQRCGTYAVRSLSDKPHFRRSITSDFLPCADQLEIRNCTARLPVYWARHFREIAFPVLPHLACARGNPGASRP